MDYQYIVIGILFIAFVIYIIAPNVTNVIDPIRVQGVRVRASLDEIFNKIIPSKKIDVVALLSSSKNVIWSDSVQVKLSSEYYDINEYILIIRSPTEIDTAEIAVYEKIVKQRLEYVVQRDDIYVSFTNKEGNSINTVVAYSFNLVLILGVTFILLSVLIFGYFKLFKK
jgi:hypothetical protein